MNFLLDNLTSNQNINIFSTPKFRDTQLDKDNPNKNIFFNGESFSKNNTINGTKNLGLNTLEKLNMEADNLSKHNENSNYNIKTEFLLKESFTLGSIVNNGINDKFNIINIKINSNKKKEKEDKCNIGSISFCDKIENYSFNNYSCSTCKDKQEINNINNLKSQNDRNFKEYNINSNKNSNNNSNNNSN